MATPVPTIAIEDKGQDLAQRTVCIKVCLGLLGNTRKVSNSQVEVDADKSLIRVSKTLLSSQELQAIKSLDSEVRHYLYNTCLPFEAGIHLLPLELIETVDERLREFEEKRHELVEVFVQAYPGLCRQAAERLRALYADRPVARSDRGGRPCKPLFGRRDHRWLLFPAPQRIPPVSWPGLSAAACQSLPSPGKGERVPQVRVPSRDGLAYRRPAHTTTSGHAEPASGPAKGPRVGGSGIR